MGVILALDYGEKRIGIAVSDESQNFAKELDFVPNKSEIVKDRKEELKNLSTEEFKQLKLKDKKEHKIELKKVFEKLFYLINCYYPEKIIVGIPYVIDKKTNDLIIGKQGKKIQRFFKKFELFLNSKNVLVEIMFIDESMTSQISEKVLEKLGSKSKKRKEKIDSMSAKILLEEYLSN